MVKDYAIIEKNHDFDLFDTLFTRLRLRFQHVQKLKNSSFPGLEQSCTHYQREIVVTWILGNDIKEMNCRILPNNPRNLHSVGGGGIRSPSADYTFQRKSPYFRKCLICVTVNAAFRSTASTVLKALCGVQRTFG